MKFRDNPKEHFYVSRQLSEFLPDSRIFLLLCYFGANSFDFIKTITKNRCKIWNPNPRYLLSNSYSCLGQITIVSSFQPIRALSARDMRTVTVWGRLQLPSFT